MNKIILKIGGMSCSACSAGLEKYLNKQEHVESATVNLVMANAVIKYDDEITLKDLEEYIRKAGFESLGIDDLKEDKKTFNDRRNIVGLLIITLLTLYISMGPMIGLPNIPYLNMMDNAINYSVVSFVLAFATICLSFDILKNGYKNLMHRTPNMDTLVSIGVISAFLYSVFGTVMVVMSNHHYVENLYYESAVVILFFVKLGRYIDRRNKEKTKEAIKSLVQMTPPVATVIRKNKEMTISIDEVLKGDTVQCKPGEKIAVDGVIVEGSTYINESFISGESIPVSKKVNDKVVAGSINCDGYILYKALKIGKDSTISEIVRLVVEAINTKAPITRLIDKVSGYFVPIVMVLAALSLVIWLIIGETFSYAISTFITVLIVSCPCALGLATPLAIVISAGRAASEGILVKTSTVLEMASKIDTVVFDKTGTLTEGNLKVSKIFNYSDFDEKELFKMIGSIEKGSEHPISKAITSYCDSKSIKLETASDIQTIPGYGVLGTYNKKKLIIGNRDLMLDNKIDIKLYYQDESSLTVSGNSILYVAMNKKIVALIGIMDSINKEALRTIEALHLLGIKTIMLTGDNHNTAKAVSSSLGISEVISSVKPNEKASIIMKLRESSTVMMVGDGINDAPSLVNADIGVSVSSGSDIAIDSADVVLMNNNLYKIADLIKISKRTIRNIKENLFFAFFYNSCMIPIACGLLTAFNISISPMIAGFAMTVSSLTVVFNSLRLRGKQSK